MNAFITGASGFLGQEILAELLFSSEPTDTYCLLIRDKGKFSAKERCETIIDNLSKVHGFDKNEIAPRISFVPGDLSEPLFGLEQTHFDSLVDSVDTIHHSGASVNFNQKLVDARKINVNGTENVIELAKRIVNKKNISSNDSTDSPAILNYVSTAYVAGDQDKIVFSKDLITNSLFKNNYEKTKAEAEALVRENWKEIPTHIYRPSMIVGNSRTGYSSSFTTIYVLGNLFIREIFKTFPGKLGVNFDIVPVDYVAKSIASISKKAPGEEPCYHLCAGVDRETSLGELCQLWSSFVEKKGFPKFASPVMTNPSKDLLSKARAILLDNSVEKLDQILEYFAGKHPKIIMGIMPYLLYTNTNPRFEMSDTLEKFPQILKPAPLIHDYHDLIADFWLNNDKSILRFLNARKA